MGIVPDYNYYSYLYDGNGVDWETEEAIAAINTYNMGITKWSDLDSRIIPFDSIIKLCEDINKNSSTQ
ncbi:MAG: hypothetical protein WC582_04995 [Patescibacteria group bacterium]